MGKKKSKAKKVAVRGRPKITVDMVALRKFASMGCSQEEAAAMLLELGMQVSLRTLERRLKDPEFREFWDAGIKLRDGKLRSRMWLQAQMMNGPGVHQAQFLARNYLGMTDSEHVVKVEGQIEVVSARDRLAEKIARISKRFNGRAVGAVDGSAPAPLVQITDGRGGRAA